MYPYTVPRRELNHDLIYLGSKMLTSGRHLQPEKERRGTKNSETPFICLLVHAFIAVW